MISIRLYIERQPLFRPRPRDEGPPFDQLSVSLPSMLSKILRLRPGMIRATPPPVPRPQGAGVFRGGSSAALNYLLLKLKLVQRAVHAVARQKLFVRADFPDLTVG